MYLRLFLLARALWRLDFFVRVKTTANFQGFKNMMIVIKNVQNKHVEQQFKSLANGHGFDPHTRYLVYNVSSQILASLAQQVERSPFKRDSSRVLFFVGCGFSLARVDVHHARCAFFSFLSGRRRVYILKYCIYQLHDHRITTTATTTSTITTSRINIHFQNQLAKLSVLSSKLSQRHLVQTVASVVVAAVCARRIPSAVADPPRRTTR